MARRLEEIAAQGVATRSIEFYAQIAAFKTSACASNLEVTG